MDDGKAVMKRWMSALIFLLLLGMSPPGQIPPQSAGRAYLSHFFFLFLLSFLFRI